MSLVFFGVYSIQCLFVTHFCVSLKILNAISPRIQLQQSLCNGALHLALIVIFGLRHVLLLSMLHIKQDLFVSLQQILEVEVAMIAVAQMLNVHSKSISCCCLQFLFLAFPYRSAFLFLFLLAAASLVIVCLFVCVRTCGCMCVCLYSWLFKIPAFVCDAVHVVCIIDITFVFQ